jgi:hypothetical protein
MDRVTELESFRKELEAVTAANAKELFSGLFARGCLLLELSDEAAAREFETSRPNVSRWRRGLVVPPAASLVLRFMREKFEQRIKVAKRPGTQPKAVVSSGTHVSASAMAAKSR